VKYVSSKKAIGGGGTTNDQSNVGVSAYPVGNPATGWRADGAEINYTSNNWTVTAYAVCITY